MRTSIGSFFLSPSSGEGSAHADRLYLSAWLCHHGLSRHAHGMARSPSAYILLAHLYASHLSRAQDLGRDGQVDARNHHLTALCSSVLMRRLDACSCRCV